MPICNPPKTYARYGTLAAILLLLNTSTALTAEPQKSDPKALQFLDEVVKAYQSLPVYADHGEFVSVIEVDGKPKTDKSPVAITLVRPNKVNVLTVVARLISDGKTLTTVTMPMKTFESQPAPKAIGFDTLFTAGPVGSALFGGPGGPMMSAVAHLLVGENPSASVRELGETITLGQDREIDGKTGRVLTFSSASGHGYNVLIDSETKLVRSIELVFDSAKVQSAFSEGAKIKVVSFSWNAGAVATQPPADTTFAFEAPKDYRKLEGIAEKQPKD